MAKDFLHHVLSYFLKGKTLADDEADHLQVVALSLFVTLLCACIVLGHLLEENRWMNESITALLLGLGSGFIVLLTSKGASSQVLQFNEELFFIYLLPPIIFNAGFQVKKKQFFRNFVAIMLYGVAGVFISFAIISLGVRYFLTPLGLQKLQITDILAFATILSATDSVCVLQVLNQDSTPLLYSLVFGEGVVNDATSVVLFRAIQKFNFDNFTALEALLIMGNFLYLFFTSTLLGAVTGLLSAYVIKTLYFGKHSTDREIAIMVLMAYLSYILAELFELSGILTVFFCGIVMSHYTWHNVTERSRVTTKHAFASMSFIAETFIFLYVGMDAMDMGRWGQTSTSTLQTLGIIVISVLLVLVGRAAFVFPLSALSNHIHRGGVTRVSFRQQIIIWWAGLMRGAVSVALAFNQFTASGDTKNPEYATILTATIGTVLSSTIIFGVLSKPLIGWLLPNQGYVSDSSEPGSPKGDFFQPDNQTPLLGDSRDAGEPVHDGIHFPFGRRPSIQMLLGAPASTIHHVWRKFDNSYMRPVFGGRGFVPFLPGSPIEEEAHA